MPVLLRRIEDREVVPTVNEPHPWGVAIQTCAGSCREQRTVRRVDKRIINVNIQSARIDCYDPERCPTRR